MPSGTFPYQRARAGHAPARRVHGLFLRRDATANVPLIPPLDA